MEELTVRDRFAIAALNGLMRTVRQRRPCVPPDRCRQLDVSRGRPDTLGAMPACVSRLVSVGVQQMLWGDRQIVNRAMAPSAPMSTLPMESIDAQAEEGEEAA